MIRLNLDNGNVGFRISTNQLCIVELRVVENLHFDLVGAADDVIVRQNVALRVNQHSGTKAALLEVRRIATATERSLVEKPVKQIERISTLALTLPLATTASSAPLPGATCRAHT